MAQASRAGTVGVGLLLLVLGVALPASVSAQVKLLRRLDATAWVRSVEPLAGAQLGFLAKLDAEAAELVPAFLGRQDLATPEAIIDVAPPGSRRASGMVMAVGGRIVLHTTAEAVRALEQGGLVLGLCRVWTMANRIPDTCDGFDAYFAARSPPLVEGSKTAGAFFDVTVAGDQLAPLSCLLTLSDTARVRATSEPPAPSLPTPGGASRYQVRCERWTGENVEETLYEGLVVAYPVRHFPVRLDWEGSWAARP